MKYKKLKWGVAGALASAAVVTSTQAQSADALIDKLVDKGILTTKEANELREETDKGFNTAYSVKSGMPDWVTALKFNGDFRGRYENFDSDNPLFVNRTRFRYRARLGIIATIIDNFEVGLRFTSADPATTGGGNPVSNNTTFQDNGTKKFAYFDAAYAKWTPLHSGDWSFGAIIGKMDNPFQTSAMVFDPDYMPEGAAIQVGYKLNDQHELRLNSAAFVLDELAASGRDPYMIGAQLLWNAKWSPKIESSLGVSAYTLGNHTNLITANIPDQNSGNTRTGVGNLAYHYNPVVGSAALTYNLDSFPFYTGVFPIKVAGEYIKNPAAPSQNKGYWAGITFGKAGKKGLWDLTYRYQRLEADAWFEELVDDDNAGFYQTAPTGGNAGLRGGTNVKGHLVKLNYSFTDSLTFSFTYYLNSLIIPSPAGSQSGGNHLMADLMWKF